MGRARRRIAWLGAALCAIAPRAGAIPVRGSVAAASRDGGGSAARAPAPLGYSRLENGRLPIARAAADHRASAVVVATPEAHARPVAPPATPLRVDARALSLSPPITIAPVGARVELRNLDRVARTLYLLDGESYLPREAIPPGGARVFKLTVAGAYEIRDADYPHARATVLVADTPYATRTDERGDWKLDLPEGRYAVRAYARGAWSKPVTVEVRGAVGAPRVALEVEIAPAREAGR